MPTVSVVTVTFNSDIYFDEYMSALEKQTVQVDLCVIVDSGSTQPAFLDRASKYKVNTQIQREQNVGVCVGNNIGWRRVRAFDYVIFLNPDAFLAPDFVEKAIAYMEASPDVGMLTPTLLRYDIEKHRTTGLVDTTGVIRSWFGGIRERDEGRPESVLAQYTQPNEIPWVCTAVAMCRREAMEKIVERDDQIFDESFFMYKDDTDVSWRVRRAGFRNMHHPKLLGMHCRGWKSRSKVLRSARLLSARNDVKMHLKNHSPFVAVSLMKYALVRFFNV